nr:ribosome-inactivating protein [Tanacetum cinerariifolium]
MRCSWTLLATLLVLLAAIYLHLYKVLTLKPIFSFTKYDQNIFYYNNGYKPNITAYVNLLEELRSRLASGTNVHGIAVTRPPRISFLKKVSSRLNLRTAVTRQQGHKPGEQLVGSIQSDPMVRAIRMSVPVAVGADEPCPYGEPTTNIIGRDGQCVDVKENKYDNGDPIVLWAFGNAQPVLPQAIKWILYNAGTIMNPRSDLVIAAKTSDQGTVLTVAKDNNSSRQAWSAGC